MLKNLIKKREHAKERKTLKENIHQLIDESDLTWRYIIYTSISAMIAALGIIMNNVGIIVGAMLIAPLLTPVVSLSVGAGALSPKLILHSIKSLSIGLALGLICAAGVTWAVGAESLDPNFQTQFGDSLSYASVAFLSGILAVYSWLRPGNDQVLPGVAIAVALMPPLAYAGAALAIRMDTVIIDTLQLIFINLTGIFIGGLITFIIYSFASKRPKIEVDMQIDEEMEKHENK